MNKKQNKITTNNFKVKQVQTSEIESNSTFAYKSYVDLKIGEELDNVFNNYYTKIEQDLTDGVQDTNISNNSTRLDGLDTELLNYYTKTESDNSFVDFTTFNNSQTLQDNIITANTGRLTILEDRTEEISEDVNIIRTPIGISPTWTFDLSSTTFLNKWIIDKKYEFLLQDQDNLSVYRINIIPDQLTNIVVPSGNASTAILNSATNDLVLTNTVGNFADIDVRVRKVTQLPDAGSGVTDIFETDIQLINTYTILSDTQADLNLGFDGKTQYLSPDGTSIDLPISFNLDINTDNKLLINSSQTIHNNLSHQFDVNGFTKLDIQSVNTLSEQPIDMRGHKITELGAPTVDGDGANKKYVDDTTQAVDTEAEATLPDIVYLVRN